MSELDPDTRIRVKKVFELLPYRRVFEHFGLQWKSDDTHQLSCVFHAKQRDAQGRLFEQNPSARYYANNGRIYCFACSEGGDPIWFVRRWQRLPTLEATLEWIGQTFGIDIDSITLSLDDIEMGADKSAADPALKFKSLCKFYADQVNDMMYAFSLQHPALSKEVDGLKHVIFVEKWRLDGAMADKPYADVARAMRDWRVKVGKLLQALSNGSNRERIMPEVQQRAC